MNDCITCPSTIGDNAAKQKILIAPNPTKNKIERWKYFWISSQAIPKPMYDARYGMNAIKKQINRESNIYNKQVAKIRKSDIHELN